MKKWLDRLADALKRFAGKAVEALPAIVRSIVGAILSFLGKAVGFVAEHIWALIVFVAELVGWWLMQKVKKNIRPSVKVDISLFHDLIKGNKIFSKALFSGKISSPWLSKGFPGWQTWPRHKGHHAEYQQA